MPNTPSSARGMTTKRVPTAAALTSPIRAAVWTAPAARSPLPAPRFCPATAAAAPMSPTVVQVMREKSWVYETV